MYLFLCTQLTEEEYLRERSMLSAKISNHHILIPIQISQIFAQSIVKFLYFIKVSDYISNFVTPPSNFDFPPVLFSSFQAPNAVSGCTPNQTGQFSSITQKMSHRSRMHKHQIAINNHEKPTIGYLQMSGLQSSMFYLEEVSTSHR